jgi:L-amino acid N-acyltransferase YncA
MKTPMTGSALLTALLAKFTEQELRDLIAAKELGDQGSTIKSTMCYLREIHDEVFQPQSLKEI